MIIKVNGSSRLESRKEYQMSQYGPPIQFQELAKLRWQIARTTRESLALSLCFPDPPRLARVRWKLKQIVIVEAFEMDGQERLGTLVFL